MLLNFHKVELSNQAVVMQADVQNDLKTIIMRNYFDIFLASLIHFLNLKYYISKHH